MGAEPLLRARLPSGKQERAGNRGRRAGTTGPGGREEGERW